MCRSRTDLGLQGLYAKVMKMRPNLTPIWRVSNAALSSCELGEFQVSMGEQVRGRETESSYSRWAESPTAVGTLSYRSKQEWETGVAHLAHPAKVASPA